MPNFVLIERNNNNPPNDGVIRNAMTAAGGTVTGIEHETRPINLKRVYYTGDPNRSTFVTGLGGNANSWVISWASTLAAENPITAGTATAGTLGTAYSLTIHNDSGVPNSRAVVFQQDPTLPSDVVSLAWLSKVCQPGTELTYNWTLDFNFVWGQTGTLKPGVNYSAGQVIPADLINNNQVTLSYPAGGFQFGPTSAGPRAGSLFVNESNDVPGFGSAEQGSVGIGMFGHGTFVTPTSPTGMGGVEFTVHPQYWVAFGNYTQGDVVDVSVLLVPTQVRYPAGQFHADCSFDGRQWAIKFS